MMTESSYVWQQRKDCLIFCDVFSVIVPLSQSDIDVYLNIKIPKNEPTSLQNGIKIGLFNVGHKSKK